MAALESFIWWGDFEVTVGSIGRFRIGPLTLWLERLRGEWRIAWETGPDPFDNTLEREVPAPARDLLAFDKVTRFAVPADAPAIRLRPALADRPVVIRPEKPFHVPPAEAVTLFMSTPVWAQVVLPGSDKLLTELPIARPSDTWFGPSPREGELCYASRTFARLHLEEIVVRPHRAITQVLVKNHADIPLALERIRIPVTQLAMFQTPDGQLWTQDATFERPPGEQMASLRLRNTAPTSASDAVRIGEPRLEGGNLVLRVLSWL